MEILQIIEQNWEDQHSGILNPVKPFSGGIKVSSVVSHNWFSFYVSRIF